MRRLKVLFKVCFIVVSILFLSLSVVNQKYCKPITKTVLLHKEYKQLDLFALNNIKAKEQVYNDLIVYADSLSKKDKFSMNKSKLSLSYLDLIKKENYKYCYLSNEIEIKELLDNEYNNILKEAEANTQYFPVEELHGIDKSKEYLLLLSRMLYVLFIGMFVFGSLIVITKVLEIIVNWRRSND